MERKPQKSNLRNIWQVNMKSRVVDIIANLIGKKKTLKKGYSMYSPGPKLMTAYKGKSKDYPGTLEVAKKNVQGFYKKKRKFWYT